jgi:HD-GYP domain-containing protein (c-di-GMP phosphodiesterase class II)
VPLPTACGYPSTGARPKAVDNASWVYEPHGVCPPGNGRRTRPNRRRQVRVHISALRRRCVSARLTVNSRLESANLSFATALVATLDARDRYTAGHSAAVAIYARDIAARLGLAEDEVQLAHLCGLVHDIGKIGLPPGLLEKPGALTHRRATPNAGTLGDR